MSIYSSVGSSQSDPVYKAILEWSTEPQRAAPTIYPMTGCVENDERLFRYLVERLRPQITNVGTPSITQISSETPL
jgi:hypothetical protein